MHGCMGACSCTHACRRVGKGSHWGCTTAVRHTVRVSWPPEWGLALEASTVPGGGGQLLPPASFGFSAARIVLTCTTPPALDIESVGTHSTASGRLYACMRGPQMQTCAARAAAGAAAALQCECPRSPMRPLPRHAARPSLTRPRAAGCAPSCTPASRTAMSSPPLLVGWRAAGARSEQRQSGTWVPVRVARQTDT